MIVIGLLVLTFGVIQTLMRKTLIGTAIGMVLIYFSSALLFFCLTRGVNKEAFSLSGGFYLALFGLIHVGVHMTVARKLFCKTGKHFWTDQSEGVE